MTTKNKKAKELSTNAIVLIILAIITLVILILGFTMGWCWVWLPSCDEQEIIITKEECRNETDYLLINTAWDDFYKTLNDAKDEWHKNFCPYYNDFNIKNMSEVCNELSTLMKQKIDTISMLTLRFEQTNPQIEVCEQVEVDEFYIINWWDVTVKIDEKILREYPEWLEENCERTKCIKEYGQFDGMNPVCVKWIEYKCEFEETYFVEIK